MRNTTTWDGKICLVICTSCIQPDTFETTFFRLKLLNQHADLVFVSIVQMLFELEWFKTAVRQLFYAQHTLAEYPLHFSGGKLVILDVVFLYFLLLAFAIDIFALQQMSGKNNDSSKSRLACLTAKRNCPVPHQTICAVKSDSRAVATFQNVGKVGKEGEAL